MRIFWKKVVKSAAESELRPESLFTFGGWGLCPQTPAFQLLHVVAALYPFIVLNTFSYYRKN